MSHPSVLTSILTDAITAFPNEANRHIFDFISRAANDENDLSSRDKEVFREAWTRCVLKSKAFGAKESKNPTAFVNDLILELTYSNKDASKLNDSVKTFFKESTAANVDAKSLKTMASIGRGLLSALNESYSCNDAIDPDPSYDEAIMVHRQRIRGAKRSWGRKTGTSHPTYCPLSESFLGSPEYLYGHMELKEGKSITPASAQANTTSRTASHPQTLAIIGVKIPNSRGAAINQARAWSSFSFLTEGTSVSGSYSLFPTTLGTDKAESGEVIFVYESHASQPIVPVFGMRLAVFLRQYPSVVLAWCKQLSAAIESLLRPDVNVIQQFLLSDLFVRDNGLLLLGNVAVIKEEEETFSGTDNLKEKNNILDFASSVLTSALCLSRRHIVKLRAQYTESNNWEKGEEEVITIMEGCTLELCFTGGSSSSLRVVYNPLGADSRINTLIDNSVAIELLDETDAATVTVDDVSHSLELKAVRPGHLLIRGSVYQGSNGLSCDLRVVVVRATPIESIDLIELTALLESSYLTKRHVFRNARCFQQHGGGGHGNEKWMSDESEVGLMNDWREVSNMLLLDPVSSSLSQH